MNPAVLIGLILGLSAVSEAFVEFDHSRLYDEKDFEGHKSVHLHDYCFYGCHIYVSLPDEWIDVGRQILIQHSAGNHTSLIRAMSRESSGRLRPYVVEKGTTHVRFINENDGQRSAPIAVWVVSEHAQYIKSSRVYDGAHSAHRSYGFGGFVTFLSAEPFCVSAGGWGGEKKIHVAAIAAGFDAFGSYHKKCTPILQQETITDRLDIGMIQSPLVSITLAVQPTIWNVTMTGTKVEGVFNLGGDFFVASPGYIGCVLKKGEGRTEYFRSSLYSTKIATYASTEEKKSVSFSIYADMSSNRHQPVEILADA